MWITVENKRKSGDSQLGISQGLVKSFVLTLTFPQSSPQVFIKEFIKTFALKREVICNYKKVIMKTHILTAVITTNFKYKTFSWRVRTLNTRVAKVAAI